VRVGATYTFFYDREGFFVPDAEYILTFTGIRRLNSGSLNPKFKEN